MGFIDILDNLGNAVNCMVTDNPNCNNADPFADGNGNGNVNNTNNGIEKRNPLVYLIVVME